MESNPHWDIMYKDGSFLEFAIAKNNVKRNNVDTWKIKKIMKNMSETFEITKEMQVIFKSLFRWWGGKW